MTLDLRSSTFRCNKAMSFSFASSVPRYCWNAYSVSKHFSVKPATSLGNDAIFWSFSSTPLSMLLVVLHDAFLVRSIVRSFNSNSIKPSFSFNSWMHSFFSPEVVYLLLSLMQGQIRHLRFPLVTLHIPLLPILVLLPSINSSSFFCSWDKSCSLHPRSEQFDCAAVAVGIVGVGIGGTGNIVSERAGSCWGDRIPPFPIFVHQRLYNELRLISIGHTVQ